MSYHPITITGADAADGACLHRVLQQSIDHYPRLAALSFTLPESLSDGTATSQARLQRFQSDVYHHFGDYAHLRTTTGKPSQPTLLRWLWGRDGRMMMLFNLAVCHHPRYDVSPEAGLKAGRRGENQYIRKRVRAGQTLSVKPGLEGDSRG